MSCKAELKIETYLEYYGDAEKVAKQIDQCHECGARLLLTHLPDYKNLLMQETSRCLDCGEVHVNVIHGLN